MTQVSATRIEIDEVVPDFVLHSIDGRHVSPRDYKQRKNLVVVYLDLDPCGECADVVGSFLDNYQDYRLLETEVLIVSPQPLEDLKGKFSARGLPFPVLSDAEGKMANGYFGESSDRPVAAFFVTDRYGALRTQIHCFLPSELPRQQEILDWFGLIEIECPECSH